MGQRHLPGDEALLIGEDRTSGERKYYLAQMQFYGKRSRLTDYALSRRNLVVGRIIRITDFFSTIEGRTVVRRDGVTMLEPVRQVGI